MLAVGSILAAAALVQPPPKPMLPTTAKAAVAFGDPLGLRAAESSRWQPDATSAAIGAGAHLAIPPARERLRRSDTTHWSCLPQPPISHALLTACLAWTSPVSPPRP